MHAAENFTEIVGEMLPEVKVVVLEPGEAYEF
jgi:hypothetical protein